MGTGRDKLSQCPVAGIVNSFLSRVNVNLEPSGQITRHNNYRVLKFSIHFGSQLGVDEFTYWQEGPEENIEVRMKLYQISKSGLLGPHSCVESGPVSVEGVKDPQKTENIETRVLEILPGQLVGQEVVEGVLSLGRMALVPELVRGLPLAVPFTPLNKDKHEN